MRPKPERVLLLIGAALVLLCAAPAAAQPTGGDGSAQDGIDDQVAEVLYQRGMTLYTEGDRENARKMFIESLERSPEGPRSADALRMLRNVNEKLGYDLDAGRPGSETEGEGPLDPYGDEGEGGEGDEVAGGPKDEHPKESAHRALLFWGGAYGLLGGLALAGPEDEFGDIGAGPVVVGLLGAGAGIGLSHLWWRNKPMTPGQANATVSAGFWGAYTFGLIGDLATGIDSSETNDIYKFIAGGGLIGTGLGALYAYKAEPTVGDVAFINSLSLYGTAGGLLLGVAFDPRESEAYSLQAVLGSAAGLGAGYYLSRKVEVSRRRTLIVDAGAAAGAALPWALIYPLVSDGSTSGDEQAIGFVSTLTLAGGAIGAWFLFGDDGDEESELTGEEAVAERYPAPPALVRRSVKGTWDLGVPMLRPIKTSETRAPAMGVDLLSGRF